MYESLTRYAGTLAKRKTTAALGEGSIGLDDFVRDFYDLKGFADTDYFSTLERYVSTDEDDFLVRSDIEHADVDFIRAAITRCIRGDRFCDGCLAGYAANGFLDRCLTRLEEMDEA